jgi:hypothetical protein
MELMKINDIAKKINEKHSLLMEGLRRSVVVAIEIGSMLNNAKIQIEHGKFMEWVENNCNFSRGTSQRYMQLFEYKTKIHKMCNLSEAYKKIKQLEYDKNKNIRKEKIEKATTKIRDYSKDEKYQEMKKDWAEENEKTEKEKQANETNSQEFKQQLEKEHEKEVEREKFTEKITQGNIFQVTIFDTIDTYLDELNDDVERLEATQNIIKYCKRIAVKFQQESVKGQANEAMH